MTAAPSTVADVELLDQRSGSGQRAVWYRARGAALTVASVLLAVAYLLALRDPTVGTLHDDGIYLVTARALAEGQGYRIISLPDSPPQTKYPILFPWLLSLVWRLVPTFPDNLPWLRLVPLLSGAAWLWLSRRLLLSCGASRATASVVVLLTALSPWTFYLGTSLLSETLFAALATGAVLALTVSDTSLRLTSVRWCALAGALSGAALLTRAAGVGVIAAGVAWLVWRRRFAEASVYVAVVVAVASPWAVWVLSQNHAVAQTYYSAAPYGAWNIVFGFSWAEKLQVLAGNILYSALTLPTYWNFPPNQAALVIGAAGGSVAVLYGMWLTRGHAATWCVAVVMAINLMWVWSPARFYLPILPLLLWEASEALRRLPRVAVALVVAILATSGAVGIMKAPVRPQRSEWRALMPLLEWVKRETPPHAIVAGLFDPAYFLFADRKAVRPFEVNPYAMFYGPRGGAAPLGTVDEFRRNLLAARVDYCIKSPGGWLLESAHLGRLLDELATAHPGSLEVVAGDEGSGFVVYAVDRARLAP